MSYLKREAFISWDPLWCYHSCEKLSAIQKQHILVGFLRWRDQCIERQLDPSHSLLDVTSQMNESQELTYLSPYKCTSRECEISKSKTSKQISIDSDKLTIRAKNDLPDQVASSEMQVYEALRRRSVALDFANLLTWQIHERYVSILFSHLKKKPVERYAKIDLATSVEGRPSSSDEIDRSSWHDPQKH